MSSTQTPYSPPAARVADPAEPEYPKPPSIGRAAKCLWISAALVILVTILAVAGISAPVDAVAAFATNLITTGLLVLIAVKLNAGRNWARWLFLILFLLGSGMFAVGLVFSPQAFLSLPTLIQLEAVVQFALQITALVFMFLPASGRWLRMSTS